MDICPCMYTQNDHTGDCVCNRCHGDIYGCECPMIHTDICSERSEEKKVMEVNRLVRVLGLSKTYKLVKNVEDEQPLKEET